MDLEKERKGKSLEASLVQFVVYKMRQLEKKYK